MEWKNKPIEWQNEGIRPSANMIEKGFLPDYRVPAAQFNHFLANRHKTANEAKINIGNVGKLIEQRKIEIEAGLTPKLDKEDGKALSSNDFTNEYKAKAELLATDHPSNTYLAGNGQYMAVEAPDTPKKAVVFTTVTIGASNGVGYTADNVDYYLQPTDDVGATINRVVQGSNGYVKIVLLNGAYQSKTTILIDKPCVTLCGEEMNSTTIEHLVNSTAINCGGNGEIVVKEIAINSVIAASYGIDCISRVHNLLIENVKINKPIGINAIYATVRGCVINLNTSLSAVRINYGSDFVIFDRNRILGSCQCGVYVAYNDSPQQRSLQISNNIIEGAQFGISQHDVKAETLTTVIENNTILNYKECGIRLGVNGYAGVCTIKNNTIYCDVDFINAFDASATIKHMGIHLDALRYPESTTMSLRILNNAIINSANSSLGLDIGTSTSEQLRYLWVDGNFLYKDDRATCINNSNNQVNPIHTVQKATVTNNILYNNIIRVHGNVSNNNISSLIKICNNIIESKTNRILHIGGNNLNQEKTTQSIIVASNVFISGGSSIYIDCSRNILITENLHNGNIEQYNSVGINVINNKQITVTN